MIERRFQKGDADSVALYSPCERYRYALTRVWQPEGRKAVFIMLNPSKATEVQNDPTIERCERRARALGFGGLKVLNIFAWRETDPKALKASKRPIGPRNDEVIRAALPWADAVICAWGVHGAHLGRGKQVERMLRETGCDLLHLGETKDGHPKHPLYIGYSVTPRPWKERENCDD